MTTQTLGGVQIHSFDKYVKSLKSDNKRKYAFAYLDSYLKGLPEPSRGELSYMAAQAVRINIDNILKY